MLEHFFMFEHFLYLNIFMFEHVLFELFFKFVQFLEIAKILILFRFIFFQI
jgi:hypothetical protein